MEAEPGQQLHDLPLLVGEVGQERCAQAVDRLLDRAEIPGMGDVAGEGGVDGLDGVVDAVVLLGQPRVLRRVLGPPGRAQRR